VEGSIDSNRPGALAYFASLVGDAGGNIIRTVNTTSPNGHFALRMVLNDLNADQKSKLSELFDKSRFPLIKIEIV
jgi:hypothetical protein